MATATVRSSESLGSLNAATTPLGVGATGHGALAGVDVQVAGTFSGTLTFQASVDGTTWVPCGAVPAAGGAEVTTTTAVGLWTVVRPHPYVRVQMTAFTSGSANVQVAAIGV